MHRVVCPFTPQLSLVLINRPRRDGALSWRWYTAAVGGIRTHDLAVASPAPYHSATAYTRTQSSVYFFADIKPYTLRKIAKYEQSEKEGGIEPAICLLQRQARRWNTHLLDEMLVTPERRAKTKTKTGFSDTRQPKFSSFAFFFFMTFLYLIPFTFHAQIFRKVLPKPALAQYRPKKTETLAKN